MKEIRIHARAGQGAITTATLLGAAVFAGGRYALAFPNFGAARMGAPMDAFVRINDKEIRLRSQVYTPDYVLVVDPTLMRGFNVFQGVKHGGIVIINARKEEIEPSHPKRDKVFCVPANSIAQEILGRPLGNTALLGAFAAASGEIELNHLEGAIKERFSGKTALQNCEAARKGFEYIMKMRKD